MTDLLAARCAAVLADLARPGTLVVLDFDGTLAPIVAERDRARLPAGSRRLLARLARVVPVAVLSGRAAADVRARLDGVSVRWVVGSHGAEWPGEEARHQAWRRLVRRWRETLTRRLADLDGVEIEAKPLALAVHFRGARDRKGAEARVVRAARGLPGAAVFPGKMVLNLVPAGAGDKGTALRRLVTVSGARRVLFIGDDVTDEAAFAAELPIPAVMVRVGRHPTSRAAYWLRRQADVDEVLRRLIALRLAFGARRARGGSRKATDAEAEPDLGVALGFMKDLRALEQELHRRSREMLSRDGVSGPQRLLVRLVGRLGPVSPARLARVLHLHPSSVTRLIRRLEARDAVRRTPHPGHRGRILLELGPSRLVERRRAGTVERAVRAALTMAEPRDVAATRRVIALVTRRLAGER